MDIRKGIWLMYKTSKFKMLSVLAAGCILMLSGCGASNKNITPSSSNGGENMTSSEGNDLSSENVSGSISKNSDSGDTQNNSGSTVSSQHGSGSSESTVKSTAASSSIENSKAVTYTQTSPNGVSVLRIKDDNLKRMDASVFGMDTKSKDNSDAFMLTLAYASEFPDTIITIPKGIYYFKPSKVMKLIGAKNVIIDGQGSEFIFSTPYHFYISGCETVEWRNLKIDWNWDVYRPANLMKVVAKGSDYIDFLLPEVKKIDSSGLTFLTMNQFDPETLTPGVANGKEFYNMQVSSVKNISDNVIRAYNLTGMGSMNIGEVYLQRNFACKCHCFETSDSQNVTYNNITIYGAAGMGFVFSNGSSHMKLYKCTIGLRPGTENTRRISTQADCVHSLQNKGHLWIEGCDFSFAGDDGTNIHDNIAQVVTRVSNTVLDITATMPFAKGDTLAFLTDEYLPLNFTAVIVSAAGNRITLDKSLPSSVKTNCIIQNKRFDSTKYYIANNYYHESRARGILAQSSDGLITGNKFYKTQGAPILIITDISTGLWSEGTGVNNLTISKNQFDHCNVNNWTALIEIKTNINGSYSRYKLMKNIVIENNTFLEFPSLLMNIISAQNVTVKNNIIKNNTALKNSILNRGGISITESTDINISDNNYYASDYMAKECMTPDSSLLTVKNLTVSGNKWIN